MILLELPKLSKFSFRIQGGKVVGNMPRMPKSVTDPMFLEAALEGLELQKQRIESQIQEVRTLLSKKSAAPVQNGHTGPTVVKRRLSETARRRIAAAQKRRWAEYRKQAHAEKKQ